jgi:hypothetical protein
LSHAILSILFINNDEQRTKLSHFFSNFLHSPAEKETESEKVNVHTSPQKTELYIANISRSLGMQKHLVEILLHVFPKFWIGGSNSKNYENSLF